MKNHALVDGNKRLGWLATAVLLEIDGIQVTHVSNDVVIAVTTGRAEIAAELRSLVER